VRSVNFRASTEDAGWTIREAAWGFEEKVLWRGGDATRGAVDRVGRFLSPLQRLIQTRLTWPLSDAWRERGRATRAALAGGAAAVAIAAGGAGVLSASQHNPAHHTALLPPATVTPVPHRAGTAVLQGVTPTFQPSSSQAAPPAPPASKPTVPAAQVAWSFAQGFVAYEVGRTGPRTNAVFATTATKQLAKALAADPPRLPAKGKVPRARVLNVVLGQATKNQISASVSLVRLRATSELRLTLTKTGDQWRVAQVLG
jgi:hypothetical protein